MDSVLREKANARLRDSIIQARRGHSLSQERAANAVGLSRWKFQRIEAKPLHTPLCTLAHIMESFGAVNELCEAQLDISSMMFKRQSVKIEDPPAIVTQTQEDDVRLEHFTLVLPRMESVSLTFDPDLD